MKLVMFHPVGHPMERGWVGRIEDDHVVHLAAQTLQSYFTGGGARDHAVYPLDGVRLLAPVLHPPSIRVFDRERSFEFANPAAIVSPDATVSRPGPLTLLPRLAAVIGSNGEIGGFTALAEWRSPVAPPPKDRDFALGLGPAVVTCDDIELGALEAIVRVDGEERLRAALDGFDWEAARGFAADGTALYSGDLLVGPAAGNVDGLGSSSVELDFGSIGTLRQNVTLPD